MKLIEIHSVILERVKGKLEDRVPVYDFLPEKERPPWVVLGELNYSFPENLSSATVNGYAIVQKIHIVTEAEKKDFVIKIKKRILNSLDDLEIEGVYILRQRFIGGSVSETENGLFYAEINFELWIQEQEEW